jgi:hypothetical protein
MAADKHEFRNIDSATRVSGLTLPGSVADRRILIATGTTSAPTLSTQGFDISGAERLAVKLAATVRDYTVVLWQWDASSEKWALNGGVGTQNITAGNTLLFTADVDGSHRAYVQVTVASGAGGTLDGWGRTILRQTGG